LVVIQIKEVRECSRQHAAVREVREMRELKDREKFYDREKQEADEVNVW
jgi:hypothetical protein